MVPASAVKRRTRLLYSLPEDGGGSAFQAPAWVVSTQVGRSNACCEVWQCAGCEERLENRLVSYKHRGHRRLFAPCMLDWVAERRR